MASVWTEHILLLTLTQSLNKHQTSVMTNTRHLLIATLLLVLSQARDVRRMGRAKHMFWFKVMNGDGNVM